MPANPIPLIPLDPADIELTWVFKRGTEKLTKNIQVLRAAGKNTAQAETLLKSSMLEIRKMNLASDAWIRQTVPAEYRKGWTKAFDSTLYATPNQLKGLVKYEDFAMIHPRAIEQIALSMKNNMNAALLQVGRQVNDVYRRSSLDAIASRLITGETLKKTSKALAVDILERTGIPYFTDKAGRQWKLDNYATMVARTTTREANTMGTLARAKAGGYNLIQLSEHYPTCELCAPLQGIVYTTDPADHRYPAWSDDYCPVHPNCLHTIHIYIERYDSDPEKTLQRAKSFDPTKDPRPLRERQFYNAIQKGNTKVNALRNQFANYQARLGKKAGTIQSFSRAKNTRGASWRTLQTAFREAGRKATGNGKAGIGQVKAAKGKIDPAKYKFVRMDDLKPHADHLLDHVFTLDDAIAIENYVGTTRSFEINEFLYKGYYATTKAQMAAGKSVFGKQILKDIDKLSEVINKATLPMDMKLVGNVGKNAGNYVLKKAGITKDFSQMSFKEAAAALNTKAGTQYVNDSFVSTSFNPARNVFKSNPVQFEILANKGQTGLVTDNWMESEILLNKGSTFEIISSKVVTDADGFEKLKIVLNYIQ